MEKKEENCVSQQAPTPVLPSNSSTASTPAPRDLYIIFNDDEQQRGYVSVEQNHTLANVRTLILENFDSDMLPPQGQDFYFCVDGTRIGKKQEVQKQVWPLADVLDRTAVSIHGHGTLPKKRGRPMEADTDKECVADVLKPPCKQPRQLRFDSTAALCKKKRTGVQSINDNNNNGTKCVPPSRPKHLLPRLIKTEESSPDEYYGEEDDAEGDEIGDYDEDDLANTNEEPASETELPPSMDGGSSETVPVAHEVHEAHKIQNEVVERTTTVLHGVEKLLEENPLFCSEGRRAQLATEIKELLNMSPPEMTVGVLGNTGVGKSSLLNALLDEASVLPTSGSRGCTATVVELRFNEDILTNTAASFIPVYKGEVEFITQEEWKKELKHLVEECCIMNEDGECVVGQSHQPDVGAAAWSKIDQVYGKGTMLTLSGRLLDDVYGHLSNDSRVVKLLTPEPESNRPYKVIFIEEGTVPPISAAALLQGCATTNHALLDSKKKWAQSFRGQINKYVYRSGDGKGETWPMIRRVILKGPWTVLSTGACLVDLPGVRDANAARAKVSENYLQNCDEVWITAPIKRAVDDGTAKQLLGEQFKRRLLMDGQYGNVKFICTHTDDCESTEIMRDHQDVAMKETGRWETMTALHAELVTYEQDYSRLTEKRKKLKEKQDLSKSNLKQAKAKQKRKVEEVDFASHHENVPHMEKLLLSAQHKLHKWDTVHTEKMQNLGELIRTRQRDLKSICAIVRNEYSKACLQNDFRAGLEELCRHRDEEEGSNSEDTPKMPIPDDFEMDVFCTCANDFLKVAGIKSSSDGPPNTFTNTSDTEIPALRANVHLTTAKFRTPYMKRFASSVGDLSNRVKVLSVHGGTRVEARTALQCQTLFKREIEDLTENVKSTVDDFKKQVIDKVNTSLRPSLKIGAAKARKNGMSVVTSWGSSRRRSIYKRNPDENGLLWPTYQAAARREGCYRSASAGEVDFNQELYDPMEKEICDKWQQTMDGALQSLLNNLENRISELYGSMKTILVFGFENAGLDSGRIETTTRTASSACATSIKSDFEAIRKFATDTQRTLNRSLVLMVQSNMVPGYTRVLNVERGLLTFSRMKTAMEFHARGALTSMFDQSTKKLLVDIQSMVNQLGEMIQDVACHIYNHMNGVYSVFLVSEEGTVPLLEPAQNELNRIWEKQRSTMLLLGIEPEELEVGASPMASLNTRIDKRFKRAEENGTGIDLCSSDDDDDDDGDNDYIGSDSISTQKPVYTAMKIKSEPGLV